MARIALPPGKKVPMKMPHMPDVKKVVPTPFVPADREELLKAFLDVIDGVSAKELERFTGLDSDRCEDIIATGMTCMEEYQLTR